MFLPISYKIEVITCMYNDLEIIESYLNIGNKYVVHASNQLRKNITEY